MASTCEKCKAINLEEVFGVGAETVLGSRSMTWMPPQSKNTQPGWVYIEGVTDPLCARVRWCGLCWVVRASVCTLPRPTSTPHAALFSPCDLSP